MIDPLGISTEDTEWQELGLKNGLRARFPSKVCSVFDLLKTAMPKQKFGDEGIRFECQGSGQCCVSRGGYGFVYLTLSDRQRFARYFKLKTRAFTLQYCQKTKGYWHLKEEVSRPECLFLKNNRCSVYEARPDQCRTWPFWPEVMNAKAWAKEVAAYCPGVGKGRLWTAEEIKQQVEFQKKIGRASFSRTGLIRKLGFWRRRHLDAASIRINKLKL